MSPCQQECRQEGPGSKQNFAGAHQLSAGRGAAPQWPHCHRGLGPGSLPHSQPSLGGARWAHHLLPRGLGFRPCPPAVSHQPAEQKRAPRRLWRAPWLCLHKGSRGHNQSALHTLSHCSWGCRHRQALRHLWARKGPCGSLVRRLDAGWGCQSTEVAERAGPTQGNPWSLWLSGHG